MITSYLLTAALLATTSARINADGDREGPCGLALTAAPIPIFESYEAARESVDARRTMLEHFLSPEDLRRLDEALVRAEHDDLRLISELSRRGLAAVSSTMTTHGPHLRHLLRQKLELAGSLNNQGTAERIEQTLAHLDKCLGKKRDHAICIDAWFGTRKYLLAEPVDMRPRRTTSGQVLFYPIDEVDNLDVLVAPERKTTLKRYLEHAFRDERSAERERVRASRPEGDGLSGFAYVPDLNLALTSLFIGRPRPMRMSTKAGLEGQTFFRGRRFVVRVVFDPRMRYVTVQQPFRPGRASRYYRLHVTDRGALRFIDATSISAVDARECVRQTHFRY